MENASKALIIAGAILLSVLIIMLGMRVYYGAKSSTNNANLDAQEISAYNSQFLIYEGKQKGDQVRKLLLAIQKNNNDTHEDRVIYVRGKDTTGISSGASGPRKVPDSPTAGQIKKAKDSVSSVLNGNPDSNFAACMLYPETNYHVSFGYNSAGLITGVYFHVWSNACTTENVTFDDNYSGN